MNVALLAFDPATDPRDARKGTKMTDMDRRKFFKLALATTTAAVVTIPKPLAIAATAIEDAGAAWIVCDGGSIRREIYRELFAMIGATYGEDNQSSVRLPDFGSQRLADGSEIVAMIKARPDDDGGKIPVGSIFHAILPFHMKHDPRYKALSAAPTRGFT